MLRGTTLFQPVRQFEADPSLAIYAGSRQKLGRNGFIPAAPRRVQPSFVPACTNRRFSGTKGWVYYSSSLPL